MSASSRPANNPFIELVAGYDSLLKDGRDLTAPPAPREARLKNAASSAATVLIFAPHPDDESLTGALALRLLRQRGMRVRVAPVTLGSRLDRRAERLRELHDACAWLGFDVVPTGPAGFGTITPLAREGDPRAWAAAVERATTILADLRPAAVFAPHAGDRHPAHAGTHLLAFDALAALPADFCCRLIETEYWAPMPDPNLMVESSPQDVADLMAAVSLHRGEVARNPYHLTLPAWMIDNVRRGTELIAGFRAAAPRCTFATLYRQSVWSNGTLQPVPAPGAFLAANTLPDLEEPQVDATHRGAISSTVGK